MSRARVSCFQVFVTASIVVFTGCANPINQRTASEYYEWGLQAEAAGNYALAERNYERALVNARIGRSSDEGVSAAMYSLGRMKGHRCKYKDAEELLLESLALQEKARGPEDLITIKRIFELGRFYLDHEQYALSLPYYQRGIPLIKKMGLDKSDPIAFSGVLKEYSYVLEKTGQKEAKNVREEAEQIRASNRGKSAEHVLIHYNCPPSNH